ncbi:hypothetical protein BEWA_033280 [Theileria equi strain WA]|uniref:Uncharacterized protein n=1 Tax=Theileria equi strain WA TaxID=1537102 RepID=L0AY41_THEEQ|nr:hypothetical protein BEWA_033280 [Theileria equi strain WA]AFZ80475.1 hypothetical protein BEWA_033280 [Theileria equi strain WA]|eukprot:XP_004830141.1 hypothetical protein BEWA_033280 [Theileria equi strain WA]
MYVEWPQSDVDRFIEFVKSTFDDHDRINLEKCVRSGTGTEHLAFNHTHEEGTESSHRFSKSDDDFIGQYLDDLWDSPEKLSLILQDAIESASKSYSNIKNKGLKDGLKLTDDIEKNIIETSWKRSLNNSLRKSLVGKLQEECLQISNDGHKFALGSEHNNLEGEFVYNLMNLGFAHCSPFIGKNTNAFSEIEFMEYNGIFNKTDKNNSMYDQCYTLWLKSSHLDKNRQKHMLNTLEKLKQIPYELTHKCKILLQAISSLCVVYMKPNISRILLHNDGSTNGVKYTCIYIPKASGNDQFISLEICKDRHKVPIMDDLLLIFRSDIDYEIERVSEKCFMIMAWLIGPN